MNRTCPVCGRLPDYCRCPEDYRDPNRDAAPWVAIALCILALGLLVGAMSGCATTHEEGRLDKDPATLAGEAACQPLPACHIPDKATSTQLELALWECVLEYRALYSACYHLVHPAYAEAEGGQ